MNAAAAITSIAATESAAVRQIWMNQEHLDKMTTTLRYDSLTDLSTPSVSFVTKV